MSSISLIGSGYYSYWFSTKDVVNAYCMMCSKITRTRDVCRDDYGDYTVTCRNCNDAIEIWKDHEDE
jgi:hypothetical protein